MKITRSGHLRDHGDYEIEIPLSKGKLSIEGNSVVFTKSGVDDFSGSSQHDYKIMIPLSDVAEILSVIGNSGVHNNPSSVQDKLSGQVISLLRIIDACKMDPVKAKEIEIVQLKKAIAKSPLE